MMVVVVVVVVVVVDDGCCCCCCGCCQIYFTLPYACVSRTSLIYFVPTLAQGSSKKTAPE